MATLKKQKARKEYTCSKRGEVIKKGDEYYRFWLTRFLPLKILCLGCKPKPSEMTTSEFLSNLYAIDEDVQGWDIEDMNDASSFIENIVEQLNNLRDETEEKLSNMPDQLQYSPNGELLQGRVDSVQEMADEFEAIDTDIDESLSDEEKEDRKQEILEEIQGVSYSGE